ncbi:hypothetical protein [Haladaptatus caseinilyticus]|uniref:hypothetical protein n=1 Tax=Haladaptatus caseinilyticus TaxID=2993314 RepID=UPI00224A5080|nr:hypothetical protein [Haladaptatus caseinilyticus]
MSGIKKSPEIPQSVPKLEAELVREAYETAGRGRRPGEDFGDGTSIDLSDAERREIRRRIIENGVSEETLVELGFDAN